jgi:hypothetical protein
MPLGKKDGLTGSGKTIRGSPWKKIPGRLQNLPVADEQVGSIGESRVAIGYWLLAIGYRLLAIGYLLLPPRGNSQ